MIIYVIDDNETNLDLFETIVRRADASLEPACFADPAQALAACEARMPDIVAVDFMMPGMDGHEFVRRFRALPDADAIPVVMITATNERQVRRTALDLGVSDFLTKPIDPYEMRARIKTIVALRKSYLQIQDRGRWLTDEIFKATQTILERERGLRLGLVIADAANRVGSVADIFQFALGEICDFAGWDLGRAFLVENGKLRHCTTWRADGHAGTIEDAPDVLAGQVIATGQTQHRENGEVATIAAPHAATIPATWAFPVLVGADTAAVLEFRTASGGGIDENRVRLLSQAGMQLGRVIERSRAEQRLIFNASHDPLTQLPNRLHFTERLQQAIAAHARDPSAGFAVLFIDLDRFKIVNDSLGHLAGDDLLVQVASRMRACMRGSDTFLRAGDETRESGLIARLGGDEFTILLDQVAQPTDALRVANRIQNTLKQPFTVCGQEIYTGASIGITLSAMGYDNSAAVLRDADLAMYRAKSQGKGCSEIFDKGMHEAAMARLKLESDLRRALRDQEFVLHFQPIVELSNRRIAGFEALVRWQIPGGRLVQPTEFIGVAEETGLIVYLGAWVLRESCRQLRAWDAAFPDQGSLTISVNVSPREFAERGLVQQVARILEETGVDPARVRLEITEGATMGDAEQAVHVLSALRALGTQVSVDDFGIGYSSLSYLHRFPLNVLKIDRSFVEHVVQKSESREVINSIVGLARSMGLLVVAEGAEHEDQIDVLKMLGCDFGQGFIFHRPLEPAAAMALLDATRRTSGSPDNEPRG